MSGISDSKPLASRVSLTLVLSGIALVALSIWAEFLRLDFTPGFGLVQIIGLLLGVTLSAAGGYLFLSHQRSPGQEISLLSDIGFRLGLTGLLVCYIGGLADMIGIGTHVSARYERPFLGPLQSVGLVIGLLTIGTGLVLNWIGNRAKSEGAGEGEGGGSDVQAQHP